MSVLLDEIETRLAALTGIAGVYTIDKSILLDDTDKRVALYEYGGQASDLGFGTPGVKFDYPRLQVVVRGEPTDYAGPRAAAQLIYEDLPKIQARTLGGSDFYLLIHPMQAPFVLERDERRRVKIVVNFRIERQVA